MSGALRFESVTYRYPGAPGPSLRDVSFEIAEGELCVVAGLSASGKSTAVRAASGLAPHFHGGEFAGRVTVGGLDTREHGPGELSAVAGTVLQDPETQVVLGGVRSELAFPLENRGHGPAAVARGVEEVALALGIAPLLDRQTHTLSGGELQRVALAAALAGRPRVVLLDEPTSQLDPVAGDELVWLLRRLNEEWGTTIVLVEHRLERCLAAADRVLAFDAGALVCDAPPRGFLEWAAEEGPALLTPAARLFARAGLRPPPSGVKEARRTLRAHGLLPDEPAPSAAEGAPARRSRRERADAALDLRGVWHELPGGKAILRGVDLTLRPGERVALMGRNGAGKSTLLRNAAALVAPTRGRVRASGRVALLLQNPGDYLLHERVGDEAPAAARAAAGLDVDPDRHPRDLSGGERQRLALAVVLGAGGAAGPAGPRAASGGAAAADAPGALPAAADAPGALPAAVLLDEPTRGLDRAAKGELRERLHALAAAGCAVMVATHDAEFAAAFADRVVLLADGRPIADGATADVLAGGWYFATETARILGGAGRALLPEDGAAVLRRQLTEVRP